MNAINTKTERNNVVDPRNGAVVGFAEVATITHNGRDFTSGGAYIDPDRAIGYPKFESDHIGASGVMQSWNGDTLGTASITSSWRINSHWAPRMFQIECVIDGRTYTGRGMGSGMIWRGKRKSTSA